MVTFISVVFPKPLPEAQKIAKTIFLLKELVVEFPLS